METEELLIICSLILSLFTIISNLLLHLRIRSSCCDVRPEGGESFTDITAIKKPIPDSPKLKNTTSSISL